MKVATLRAPIGTALSLLLCSGLSVSLAGCNFFRKSSSSTKSVSSGAKALAVEVKNEQGKSINDTIGDQKSYVLTFTFTDPNFTAGLANLTLALNASDSSVFEKTQLSVSMGVTIRHADGTADTRTAAQPVLSNKGGVDARALYPIKKGDVLEIAVDNIPEELRSGTLYAFVAMVVPKDKARSDTIDASNSYWSAAKTVPATSTEEATQRTVKVGTKGLYTFETAITSYKPSTALLVQTDDATPCTQQPNVVRSGSVSSTLAGPPWSAPVAKPSMSGGPSGVDDTCTAFRGFVTVETEAVPVTSDAKVEGLVPNETYVGFTHIASGESDYANAKLGTMEAPVGPPGDESDGFENIGRYDKQRVSYLVKGVKAGLGLQLSLSANFLHPMNLPEVATSTFDGTGLAATLRYASGPKAGTPVTDSTGAALEVFKPANPGAQSKNNVSFEVARLPDLDAGDYEVTLDFPPNFPAGVYVRATLIANSLREIIDGLDPAIMAEFKARDAASGAVVHDWPQADYSTAFNPAKRERIAMVAVAKAMEEIRDAMHFAVNQANPWTGVKTPFGPLNTIARKAPVSCLGSNEAPHWSDITLHYYCQLDEGRSCYTGGIRDTAGYMQKVQAEETAKGGGEAAIKGAIACRLPSMKVGPVTLPVLTFDPTFKYPTLRQYVFNQCATPPSAALDSRAVPASAIPGCLARDDIRAYAPAAKDRTHFSWVTKDPERAKVFRYIMEAPTFAFDEKDQQDLINAFYRVTNPSDPSDCAKRPRRAIDKEPDTGKPNICEIGHDQVPPRAAAGR